MNIRRKIFSRSLACQSQRATWPLLRNKPVFARQVGDGSCVVKAQIYSGGRGEAGGVKVCNSETEVREFAGSLLGTNLITKQTDANGKRIDRLGLKKSQTLIENFILDLHWIEKRSA